MRIVAVLISALSAFFPQAEGALDCTTADKGCGQCIKLSPECAWCEDSQYISNGQPRPRCDTFENHGAYKCQKRINPKSKQKTHSELPLDYDNKVKVTPQNLTMYLRPGQPSTITVKMKTPEHFPVDLYYLMDLSGSMLKDVERLATLGRRIAKEMSNITQRFRLGFGSFVDKPVAPYIDTYPPVLKHPNVEDKNSVPAFGFSNVLPLTPNYTDFEQTVNSLSISGNVDNPEGGLDALMQVAVCDQDIGWTKKEDARRLVIFTTDAAYHFAGDGLLGGVVKPNDGRCYTKNGVYKASKLMDYPSVGFLRQVLVDNQVVPIFAITSKNKALYTELAEYFGEDSGAVADLLNRDSSNIVPLIREAYEKIAQTQTIHDNAPEGVEVKYDAYCPDGIHMGSRTCTGVEIGQEVSFKVSVTVKDCNIKHDSFALKTAFGDVHIRLSYICSCDCEKKENMESNSPHCSGNGTLQCGKCLCNTGMAGRICQCPEATKLDESRCMRDNATGKVCSGRGQCECGECRCSPSKRAGEKIDGKNCECSNKDCKRDSNTGKLCGGNGDCICNKCVCSGNWTGDSCSCTKEKTGCLKDGVLCSGRGKCECGKCICNASLPFRGAFCDECPSCVGQCAANKDCVQCTAYGTGKLAGDRCDKECKDVEIEVVDEVTSDMGERCSFFDVDDCSFVFAYQTDDNKKIRVSVEREKQCPKEASALAIILGVVGGILGVGLALLLIWKLLATIQDRREFAKFDKDRQNAKWDTGENPIFKQATTTFQNPTYGGR